MVFVHEFRIEDKTNTDALTTSCTDTYAGKHDDNEFDLLFSNARFSIHAFEDKTR